jgi:hypothetical protein
MPKDPRKDALKKAWKQQARQSLEDSIPIPHADLRALFDFLDDEHAPPCDHTLGRTREFLEQRGLGEALVLPWLARHGGHCDCEVIFNVEDKFGEIVGSVG